MIRYIILSHENLTGIMHCNLNGSSLIVKSDRYIIGNRYLVGDMV